VILINGGAAIAILAFLGNVWSKDEAIRAAVRTIIPVLTCFLFGVAMGVACAGVAYLAQTFFTHSKNKIGISFQIVAILLAAGALSEFVWGAWHAADIFTHALGF
jgi:hypothetical protein